ncbi:MAG: hypothetical protein H7839_01875 [Magnetococcus sp. YQC-5]
MENVRLIIQNPVSSTRYGKADFRHDVVSNDQLDRRSG